MLGDASEASKALGFSVAFSGVSSLLSILACYGDRIGFTCCQGPLRAFSKNERSVREGTLFLALITLPALIRRHTSHAIVLQRSPL